jgi:hypothetical protein
LEGCGYYTDMDNLTPEEERILDRAMGRFKFRMAMHRMGVAVKPTPPYCTCAFIDDDGTYYPAEPAGCELHPDRAGPLNGGVLK